MKYDTVRPIQNYDKVVAHRSKPQPKPSGVAFGLSFGCHITVSLYPASLCECDNNRLVNLSS